MAASAAKLTYKKLFRTSIGGRFLTLIQVSIEGEAEEYKKGGIAINKEELGLPDSIIDACLCLNFLDEKNEKAYNAEVIEEKLVLFATGAEKGFSPELTEAEGKTLKGYTCTLLVIGR
jgi:hypothetical protein